MTKKILPTPEQLRELLTYDPETGKLFWKVRSRDWFNSERYMNSWNARYAGREAFTASDDKGYRRTNFSGICITAHRAAWAIFHGEWPSEEIDHINNVRCDNRIENLRPASRTGNNRNRLISVLNTSGLKGASWNKQSRRWVAQIAVSGKKIFLGYHDTAEDAHNAYCAASIKYHGEFARHG